MKSDYEPKILKQMSDDCEIEHCCDICDEPMFYSELVDKGNSMGLTICRECKKEQDKK